MPPLLSRVFLGLIGPALLLAACTGGADFIAKDEPWRAVEERACLTSGIVHETAFVKTRSALGGPSVCGAEQPFEMAAADRTRPNDPSTCLIGIRGGGDRDAVPLALQLDLERRVIEVLPLTALPPCLERFEDTAVEAHAVTTRAQRDPIELHGCCPRLLHRLEHSRAEGRSTSEPAPIASAGSPQALR